MSGASRDVREREILHWGEESAERMRWAGVEEFGCNYNGERTRNLLGSWGIGGLSVLATFFCNLKVTVLSAVVKLNFAIGYQSWMQFLVDVYPFLTWQGSRHA